jgi:Sulfate permease family
MGWATGDLIAGLTVGLVLVPQSMSYAVVANLPPQYGLYSSFIGAFIYCVSPLPVHFLSTLNWRPLVLCDFQRHLNRSGSSHVTRNRKDNQSNNGRPSRSLGCPYDCNESGLHLWFYHPRFRPSTSGLDCRVHTRPSCQWFHDRLRNQHCCWPSPGPVRHL